jgi:hypothetical protein
LVQLLVQRAHQQVMHAAPQCGVFQVGFMPGNGLRMVLSWEYTSAVALREKSSREYTADGW